MRNTIFFKIQLVYFLSPILVSGKFYQEVSHDKSIGSYQIFDNQQKRLLTENALNFCQKDVGNCKRCANNYCLECKDNYVFPKCECKDGQQKTSCKKCDDKNCMICSEDSNFCKQCQLNFTEQDGKCIQNNIDKNYYFAEYQVFKDTIILNFFSDQIKLIKVSQPGYHADNCDEELKKQYKDKIGCQLKPEQKQYIIILYDNKDNLNPKAPTIDQLSIIQSNLQLELAVNSIRYNYDINYIDNFINFITPPGLKLQQQDLSYSIFFSLKLGIQFSKEKMKVFVKSQGRSDQIEFNQIQIDYDIQTTYGELIFYHEHIERYCKQFDIIVEYEGYPQIKTTQIHNYSCNFKDGTFQLELNIPAHLKIVNPNKQYETDFKISSKQPLPQDYLGFEWICIDQFNKRCLNRYDQPLIIENQLNIKIDKDILKFNQIYRFQLTAYRKTQTYWNNKSSFQISTGLTSLSIKDYSYYKSDQDFYDPITVKLDQLNYQSSLNDKRDKLLFSIILIYENEKKVIQQNNTELNFKLSEQFPNIDQTNQISIEYIFQVYDPILNYKFSNSANTFDPKSKFIGCKLEIQSNLIQFCFQLFSFYKYIDSMKTQSKYKILVNSKIKYVQNYLNQQRMPIKEIQQFINHYFKTFLKMIKYLTYSQFFKINYQGYYSKGNVLSAFLSIQINDCETQDLNYEFFYYNNDEDKSINKKNILSSFSTQSSVDAYFLPGKPVIVVVAQNSQQNNYNMTQNVLIKQNSYDEKEFEEFIKKTYSNSLDNKSIAQELQIQDQIIQTIQKVIKYYQIEINSNINTYLIKIFQQLSFPLINLQIQDLQILKKQQNTRDQLRNILPKPFIQQANKDIEEQIKEMLIYIDKNIKDLYESQKQESKNNLTYLIKEFMSNLYILKEWDTQQCLKYFEQNTNVMQGLSKLIQITKDPFIIQTKIVNLEVDKLYYNDLLIKHFETQNNNPTQDQLNKKYIALKQKWPESFPLFRDEIINLNQDKKIDSNISYPFIKVNILSEDSSFKQTPEIASSPIQINFGLSEGEQKRKCIQRQSNGKWSSDHCKYKTINIENQKVQMKCECSQSLITTIIDDFNDLFDNENLKNSISKDGILRIFSLDNWYQYALIWTIIGLNIFLIISVLIGVKLDKQDKQFELQVKQSNLTSWAVNQNLKEDENKKKVEKKSLFIKIKNTQVSQLNKLNSKLKEHDIEETSKSKQTDVNQKQNALNQVVICQNKENKQEGSPNNDENVSTTSKDNWLKQEQSNRQLNTEIKTFTIKDEQIQLNIISTDNENNTCTKQSQQQKLNQFHTRSDQNFLSTQGVSQFQDMNSIQNIDMITQDFNTNNKLVTTTDINTFSESENNNKLDKHTEQQSNNNKDTATKIHSQHIINTKQKIESDVISSNSNILQLEDKKQQKLNKKKAKMQTLIDTKKKMETYLELENKVKGVFFFHNLFSIFIISYTKEARSIRFIIYYCKMVWLLTINSIFGQNLNFNQTIILSLLSWIVLFVFTGIVKFLFLKKYLKVFSMVLNFAFLVLCYLSLFSVMAMQDYQDANNWVGTYFITFFINEFVLDLMKSFLVYIILKKSLKHVKDYSLIKIISYFILFKSFLK